ncbi:MAG: hypothetical protein K1X44_00925 [Alphaproteobacteria bacterium]|nr:hypothetical protein [Alphaproteobacteria bacterium]
MQKAIAFGDLLPGGKNGMVKSKTTNGQMGTLSKTTLSITEYENGDRVETYPDGTTFTYYSELVGHIIIDPKGDLTFNFKGYISQLGKYIVADIISKLTFKKTIAYNYGDKQTIHIAPPELKSPFQHPPFSI